MTPKSLRRRFLLALAVPACILTAPAKAESLIDALAKAYGTNPQLLSERAALRVTDEEVPQALANSRPTVTLTGEAGHLDSDSNVRKFESNPTGVELIVTQPLYRGGRTVADTARAEADVLAGRAQLASIEQAVLLSTVEAYMNVVRDAAVLRLNRNNEDRLRRQLQATQDRFRVGEVTRTDVAQAEARVSSATAARIQAAGDRDSSRAVYRNVVGDLPGTLVGPKPQLSMPANEEEARTQAIASNPSVQRALHRVSSSRNAIRTVRGGLRPSLRLRGEVSTADDSASPDSSRETQEIIAELTIPLYQAGDVYSRLRAAKETLAQRQEELDNARRVAGQDAATSWSDWQAAIAQVRSFKEAQRANEIALEGVQREALVGSRTVLDVLDAEQELLDSQVSLVRAERDEVVASFGLISAIGNLTAAGLKLPVKLYDPKSNYHDVRGKWFGAGKDRR
jgi:TolC family type I secretion outer membrane protein